MAAEEKPIVTSASDPSTSPGSIITPQTEHAPEPVSDKPLQSVANTEIDTPVRIAEAAPATPLTDLEPAESAFAPLEPADKLAETSVAWTASEFIAHDKSPQWFITLGVAATVIAVIVWLLTKDLVSALVIIAGAAALGTYGSRQPRPVSYELNTRGITIGTRYHALDEFRSFAILPEGAFSSIVFMPLKRFSPLTTIYYGPDDEEAIVRILAVSLPLEERDHDMVDRLMHRIRF